MSGELSEILTSCKMAAMLPSFRRNRDNKLDLSDTTAAATVPKQQWRKPHNPTHVLEAARAAVVQHGGSITDELHVLGQHSMQFGKFQDYTFRWVLENALGYAAWLLLGFEKDPSPKPGEEARTSNKEAFKKYVLSFPEGREAVSIRRGPPKSAALLSSTLTKSKSDIERQVKRIYSPRKLGKISNYLYLT